MDVLPPIFLKHPDRQKKLPSATVACHEHPAPPVITNPVECDNESDSSYESSVSNNENHSENEENEGGSTNLYYTNVS